MTEPLSPAAQAVLDAVEDDCIHPDDKQMTKTTRNISKELLHHVYCDMENGNDEDHIDNDCLIKLLTEIVSRLESIERRLNNLESSL